MTKIWIDADSCAKKAREYASQYAERSALEIVCAANAPIDCGSYAKLALCPKEKDAADNYIAANACESDLVITRDILLAERLLANGVSVINDCGTAFTRDNIKQRLKDREFNLQLAEIGLGGSSKSAYTAKRFDSFVKCFHQEIKRALRK
ncbi:MAG: DUF188 domain-containing protein [Treponema sp.]